MPKMTRRNAGIAVIVLLVLAAAGVYFKMNYHIVKASELGDKQTPVLKETQVLNLAVVKKAKNLSGEEAALKAIDFANKNLLTDGSKAEFVSVEEQSGLYAFKLKLDNQEYESYVTKDGSMFFVQGIDINESSPTDNANQGSTEVAKTDRPDVKVFVMSYCPYGLQAQKMYLPAYELLKGKADMTINFVNYAMHGKKELDDNLRQYCIEKEQGDKYAAYLKCFTESAQPTGDAAADYESCLTAAGVDNAKLDACVASTDAQYKVTADYNDKSTWVSGQFPKFAVEDGLNTQYSVQGSPTIVINGTETSPSSRTPEQFKQLVCAAFNTAPEECNQTLSDTAPSTGFGAAADASGGAASGGCGN